MTSPDRELDANLAEKLTGDLEHLSDRDKNFAAYIEILDRVEGLLERLKAYEIPDREQREFHFTLPEMSYSECPGSLGDVLLLDVPLELDVTLTQEVNAEDVRALNTPEEFNAFYGVSLSLSDRNNTVFISRDKSVKGDMPQSAEELLNPVGDVVVPKIGQPKAIPTVTRDDMQRLTLLAVGLKPEEIRGTDMEQADIFAPEKRAELENVLYDSSPSSVRVLQYAFPEQDASVSATYQASADNLGQPTEDLISFTISFGDPRHVAVLRLDKGLEVSVSVGENSSPDSGEIVKFVEALNDVTQSIENRRPRVVTATPAEMQALETDRPDITLL